MWTMCKECELCAKNMKCEQRMWNMCKEKNKADQLYSVPEDVSHRTVSHVYSHVFIVDRFLFLCTGSVTSMELNHLRICTLQRRSPCRFLPLTLRGFSRWDVIPKSELWLLSGFSLKCSECFFPGITSPSTVIPKSWTWFHHWFFPQMLGWFFPWDLFAFSWWSLNLNYHKSQHFIIIGFAWSHILWSLHVWIFVFVSHRVDG